VNQSNKDREETFNSYRYLCTRGVRKFIRQGIDRRDLEQVAAIGLIKATDRFKPELGTPFEAYAWTFVLGELMHYVRDSERMLRAPRRVRDLERRCAECERVLWNEHGREATQKELALLLGVSECELADVFRFREERMQRSVETLGSLEQGELSYTIECHIDKLMIEAALAQLTALERKIIREIYENDTPIGVLANRIGYSRRHVSRMHSAALKKLVPFWSRMTA
jgi:RNA polymerase sigma-B factor